MTFRNPERAERVEWIKSVMGRRGKKKPRELSRRLDARLDLVSDFKWQKSVGKGY